MKFLLISLFLCSLVSARTLEELKAEYIKALETQNHDLLWSLSHHEGYSEGKLKEAKAQDAKYFSYKYDHAAKNNWGSLKVLSVEENDINEHYPHPYTVHSGVRGDFPSKPLGCWKVLWRFIEDGKSNKSGSVMVYGVINGVHCFLIQKPTPIDWDGPEDKQLAITTDFEAKTPSSMMLKTTWNASGVTLTKKTRLSNDNGGHAVHFFYGQYIEKITILEAAPYESLEVKITDRGEKEAKTLFEKSFKEGVKVLYQRP